MRYYIEILMIILTAQLAKVMSPKSAYRVANAALITGTTIMFMVGFHMS